MKLLLATFAAFLLAPAFAADAPSASDPATHPAIHRYLIERTFTSNIVKGLNADAKRQVNANNAKVGVKWLQSYATANGAKTYCIYEGPSEQAIRQAAELNKIPVDSITEIPITLAPR